MRHTGRLNCQMLRYMELNNYDKSASFYDFLSRLVFFKAQVHAQLEQLSFIPPSSKVLIVGGGTGWILEELSNIHQHGLTITYVEISSKMMDKARRRNLGQNQVSFIQASIESYEAAEPHDVVHTAFLFDNFSVPRIKQIYAKLDRLLKPGGLWLFADFHYESGNSPFWQGILLRTMYLFFGAIANVEAKNLTPMRPYFDSAGYEMKAQKGYYHNFIQAIVFLKALKSLPSSQI
jgi:ubiquinone/menaquinone biosynthesis C-methylase UbiE